MASKKYTLILALLGLFQTATFAQSNNASASSDWALDSSKVSTKQMPQHNEFMNNQFPYPSTPRNQWELGISGGPSMIIGDIDSHFGSIGGGLPSIGGGISVRKALGHVISLRAGWNGSFNNGLDYRWRRSVPGPSVNPWAPWTAARMPFVANYKARIHQVYLDGIVSLNTISHYRGNPKTNWYVLAGYSAVIADVNTYVPTNSSAFANINYLRPRKDVKSDLKDIVDNGTERLAPVDNRQTALKMGSKSVYHGLDFGGGIAFKLSDRVNLGIEQKFTAVFNDYLDGVNAGKGNDMISATQVRLNFNIGNASKSIQPLWWVNPNNFIYNELNMPKHMKIPTPVLPDADGDGVTDQFDQEPNTPAGAAVDSHGVAKDTDGDGVPDYKDKELLTPQNCFPVDADGVGKCPEPPCCAEMRNRLDSMRVTCNISGLPSIQFRSGSLTLSSTAQSSLANIAQQINANPNCKVRVIGYGASDKRSQQLSWDRVNAVIRYLVDKQGISESRLIFAYGQQGDPNTVDLEGTTEEGPNTVPAPHPNLRGRR